MKARDLYQMYVDAWLAYGVGNDEWSELDDTDKDVWRELAEKVCLREEHDRQGEG